MMQLGLVEPDTAERRIEVLREMLLVSGQSDAEPLKLLREANGKQTLQLVSERRWWCNFSRVRNAPHPFGVIAISDENELGIDVEVWPDTAADPDFLETISTSEDARAISSLSNLNLDAGRALWVIKEAALKCSGEVMIDPRHLTVSAFRDGTYRTAPSLFAGSPVPDVIVALFRMKASKWPDCEFVCGIAVPYGDRMPTTNPINPIFTETGWEIVALKTRTHS